MGQEPRQITNIVMMGMGEPLYNFESVRDGILTMSDDAGLSISKRKITLSTSGIVPKIKMAGDEIGSIKQPAFDAGNGVFETVCGDPNPNRHEVAACAWGICPAPSLFELAGGHLIFRLNKVKLKPV